MSVLTHRMGITMRCRIEVVVLPVSDVDRAVAFYTEKAGFTLDVDYAPTDEFRVVQLRPPGSSCSIQIGIGLTDATPGQRAASTRWSTTCRSAASKAGDE